MIRHKRRFVVNFLYFILIPIAGNASQFTISPSSGGVYTLEAEGLSNIVSMDVSIFYNSSHLSNPKISPLSLAARATLETVSDRTGSLQFKCTKPSGSISGSGQLAQLRFDVAGQSPNAIIGLSVQMTDTQGIQSTAETSIEQDEINTKKMDEPGKDKPASPVAVSNSTAPPLQTPTAPRRGQANRETTGQETRDNSLTMRNVPGVLDHVRTYVGKDFGGLLPLFVQGKPPGLHQEPAICLADGRTKVRLTVSDTQMDAKSPSFVLSGASFVTLVHSGGGSWTIEAIPHKGAYQASLTVVSTFGSINYPLTVAPPLHIDPAIFYLDKEKEYKALDAASKNLRIKEGAVLPEYVRKYIVAANLLACKPAVKAATGQARR